jgi:hypothetical protein
MKAKFLILAVLLSALLAGCVGVPVDVGVGVRVPVYRPYGGYNHWRRPYIPYQRYPLYNGYPGQYQYRQYDNFRRW